MAYAHKKWQTGETGTKFLGANLKFEKTPRSDEPTAEEKAEADKIIRSEEPRKEGAFGEWTRYSRFLIRNYTDQPVRTVFFHSVSEQQLSSLGLKLGGGPGGGLVGFGANWTNVPVGAEMKYALQQTIPPLKAGQPGEISMTPYPRRGVLHIYDVNDTKHEHPFFVKTAKVGRIYNIKPSHIQE